MKKNLLLLFLFLLFLPMLVQAQKVGLVLSGGGAKGLTHIGIIRALEENNIPIDYITGTSMGAIVGSLYAMGYSPDDMETLLKSEDFKRWYSGGIQETIALSAYVDNRPVEEAVDEVMDGFEGEDEVVVLTDLMVGSVNQKFFKYRTRPHTHIVSGMNLPLAFQIAMEPQGKYITEERMKEIIGTAKEELKYVNEVSNDEDEEDE